MPSVVHRAWQSKFLVPEPVYLDSSVTVGVLTPHDRLHQRASAFWADHIAAGRELQVSLLTLDETILQLLRGQVAKAHGKNPNQIKLGILLKQQPRLLAAFAQNLRLAVQYVLAWTKLVGGAPTTADVIVESWLDRMNDVGGLHDALHLSFAEHGGAKSFATGDRDFAQIHVLPVPLQIVKL